MDRTRLIPAALFVTVAALPAQEATAVFDAPVVLFPDTARVDDVGDLNGDGRPDAVSLWNTQYTVARLSTFLNDGNGGFTTSLYEDWQLLNVSGTGFRSEIRVGRFDADGYDDFVAFFYNEVRVYRGTAAGPAVPHARWTEPTPFDLGDLAVGDFDGDGLSDFALTSSGQLRVYCSTGTAFDLRATATSASEIHAAEIDGDGITDIVAARPGRYDLYVLSGTSLTQVQSFSHGLAKAGGTVMHAFGDVDGDGDQDIVAFGDWGEYVISRRSGPATFAVESRRTGGPATGLADIDGDGDLDGVCCGGGGGPSTSVNVFPSAYEIAHNRGGGDFAPSFEIPSLGARRLAAAVDVDADGDLDLVAGRTVLYARGAFTAPVQPSLSLSTVATRYDAVDIDGDGDPDLIANSLSSLLDNYVSYRNDGAGGFTKVTAVKPPWPTAGFDIGPGYRGDFDGDGDEDRIVGLVANNAFSGMQLWLNRGGAYVDGGRATAQGVSFDPNGLPTWFGPRAFVGDFDRDGDQDIVPAFASTWVWHNDGRGFFTRGQQLALGYYPVGSFDIDGDTILDLVLQTGTDVGILFGNGDGTFGQLVSLALQTTPYQDEIAVVDFEGDGDPDIVGIDSSRYRPQVLVNQGGRQFGRSEITWLPLHNSGGSPRRVRAADVDGDGNRDLLVTPVANAYTGAWIVRSAGNGTYHPAVAQIADIRATLDADGDGDLDAIAGDRLIRVARYREEAGHRIQYGQSGIGQGGIAPTLGTTGPVKTGASITTRMNGAPGGGSAVYTFALTSANLPNFPLQGLTVYAFPFFATATFVLGGAPGAAGDGWFEFTYTLPPAATGLVLYKQAFVLDPSRQFGLNYTNGVEIRYGR